MNINYKFIQSQSELEENLNDIYSLKKCSLDSETTGLDCFKNKLLLLQIGTLDQQYIIDARKVNILPLKDFLEDENKIKTTINGKFDGLFLKILGIDLEGIVDCYLIEQILNCGKIDFKTKGYFSLAGMSKRYLGIDLKKSTRNEFINFHGDFTEEQLIYSTRDIITPLLILEKQKPLIIKENLQKIVNLENSVVPAFIDLSYNGFYLDKNKWEDLIIWQKNKLIEAKNNLNNFFSSKYELDLFGNPNIDYSSPLQLTTALNKTGYNIPDTNHATLLTKLPKDVSDLIINYREIEKSITSFGERWIDEIHPITNKLHPKIFQQGAMSGRVAMTSPPLQTVKREKEYRRCFTSQEDTNLIISDFSGQELNIAIQDSQEPLWLQLNKEGKNIHKYMGENIVWNKLIDKNSSEYNITKNLNFAAAYGASSFKVKMFFKENNMPCDDLLAQEILDRVANAIPVGWKKFNNNGSYTVINGYSSSLLGRKRYFTNIPSYNKKENFMGIIEIWPKDKYDKDSYSRLSSIMREGRNHVEQSTGADMSKLSMIYFRKSLKEKGWKNNIKMSMHDELVSECNKIDSDEYLFLQEQAMLKAEKEILPDVIPKVESHISDYWEK